MNSLRRDRTTTTQALLSSSGDMLDEIDPRVAGSCDDEVGPIVVHRCLRHGCVATPASPAETPPVTTMQNHTVSAAMGGDIVSLRLTGVCATTL